VIILVAIAFAAGIAIGDWVGIGAGVGLSLLAALIAVAVQARVKRRLVGLAALGLGFGLGVVGQAARPRPPPELTDGARWDLEGRVAAPPERAFGVTHLPVALDAAERGGMRRAVGGRLLVAVNGDPIERLLPGDRVRLPSTVRAPRGLTNPGAPDPARRAAALGVMGFAGVHAPPMLARMADPPPAGPPWLEAVRALEAWRQRMLDGLRTQLAGDDRALVASLVLGDRGDVDRSLDDAFRVAGVSHVLSVSGLHLAIAAFLFYAGLTRLLLRIPGVGRGWPVRRLAALAALPATLAYTLVTGAQVATLRAFVVAGVWFAGVALGRRATAVNALGIAALALLAWSPLELFDPSFQLSFAAALGGALLGARWSRQSGAAGDHGAVPLRLLRWALRLVLLSAAAILATIPIAAWHFSQFAPAGLLSNLVVVPLAELALLPAGLTGCVLASAHLPPGGGLVLVAGFLAHVMAGFVRWFAGWAPSWHVPQPSPVELVAWYAGLVALGLGLRRAPRVALVCALVVAGSLLARAGLRHTSTRLTATFLDVGQGDACVLELPRGKVVVIDGGGSFDAGYDPGEQVVAPFLWRRGIRRIDLIVLSHPHPDHANGLGFLVEHFAVGEVWTNGEETSQPGTVRLLQAAAERGVPVGLPRPLELGGARLVPLAGAAGPDAARSENDNSLVLAVEHGGRRLLFAGDVEADAEAALIANGGVAADVLKVPHHGSRTSSTAPFLAAVHPQIAVISVGDHNRWGFPHPSVLARYAAAGARVLRTDLDGAIAVTVTAGGTIGAGPAR
jgi:competence protein ComEC